MKKYIFISILILTYLLTAAQEDTKGFGEEEPETEYYFAFRIIPSGGSTFFQCALIRFDYEGKLEVRQMNAEQWARQAMGYEKSLANPGKTNFVTDKYEIFELPPEIKELNNSDILFDVEQAEEYASYRLMIVMNNLWRLRYERHPYEFSYRKGVNKSKKENTSENKKNMRYAGIDTENNSSAGQNTPEIDREFKGWAKYIDPDKKAAPSDAQMAILKKYGMNEITDYVIGENAFKLMKDMMDTDWQQNYINATGTGEDPALK